MSKADCPRCGASFDPHSQRVELEKRRVPPEGQTEKLYLCPRCSEAFEEWMEGSDDV